jgi:primosomal protein N''
VTSDYEARIAELERELKIANGFHDVAVKERDYERLIVDNARQRIEELERQQEEK